MASSRLTAVGTLVATAALFFPHDSGAETNITDPCAQTCLLKTCDAWVQGHVNTCSGLEDLGCDVRAPVVSFARALLS
jgi:hypothetical protein